MKIGERCRVFMDIVFAERVSRETGPRHKIDGPAPRCRAGATRQTGFSGRCRWAPGFRGTRAPKTRRSKSREAEMRPEDIGPKMQETENRHGVDGMRRKRRRDRRREEAVARQVRQREGASLLAGRKKKKKRRGRKKNSGRDG